MTSGVIHEQRAREGEAYHLVSFAHPPDWQNPSPAPRYDLLILGGGPAGLAAADAAAQCGIRTALIEAKLLGGVSLVSGSIPSKALLRTARLSAEMHYARHFGATAVEQIQHDFAFAMGRMRRLQARLSEYQSAERLKLAGIDLFFGTASFTGPDSLAIGGLTLRFTKAIIATGARPEKIAIRGLDQTQYVTSENVFDMADLPKRLLVVGGGPLGCELAQAFHRLGSKVILVMDEAKFLPREERDAAQILNESLSYDGVEIHLNTSAVSVTIMPDGTKHVELLSQNVRQTKEVDQILAGVGRLANVQALALERAGVLYDVHSGIHVDDYLCTSNPQIYAAGDVCLSHRYTHVAQESARIAFKNALSNTKQKWNALIIPWCTYTDPEIATVGLSTADARHLGIPVKSFTTMMHDTDRAILESEEKGFVKIHVRDGVEEILGATIVGAHAGELIGQITLAMEAKLGLSALARAIQPYPTRTDAIRQTAEAFDRSRHKTVHEISRPIWPMG